MTANEIRDFLTKMDKDVVCGCLASVLYQLVEHGIYFGGYEEEKPSTLKATADGGFEIVPGIPDPLEHRAKLDFSKFVNEGEYNDY